MIAMLDHLRDELLSRFEDQPDWHLYLDLDPAAPFGPNGAPVPAIIVTTTAPSPLLGDRVVHVEALNPMSAITDDLIGRCALDIRTSIGRLQTNVTQRNLS